MTAITEPARNYEFLIQPGNGDISFEEVTVVAADELLPGAVLGRVTAAAAVASAQSGNTGNATISAVTTGANVVPGAYQVEFINATEFLVFDPNGNQIGNGSPGTAFSTGSHLTFTITAGGTAMVAGDGFTITVAAGSGNYVAYSATATNGAATVAGVLMMGVPANTTAKRAIVARDATVKKYKLVYTGTEAVVVAGLKYLGIIAR